MNHVAVLITFQLVVIIYLTYTSLRLQSRYGKFCRVLKLDPNCSTSDFRLAAFVAAACSTTPTPYVGQKKW